MRIRALLSILLLLCFGLTTTSPVFGGEKHSSGKNFRIKKKKKKFKLPTLIFWCPNCGTTYKDINSFYKHLKKCHPLFCLIRPDESSTPGPSSTGDLYDTESSQSTDYWAVEN